MPDVPGHPDAGGQRLDPEVAGQLRARRQLLLQGPLDGERATRLTAELMALETDGPDPVTVTLNSPGGDLASLFSVTDTLQAMRAPVNTRCLGQARGTAAALVAAGTGTRRAGAHAQLVLQLPGAQAAGSATDLDRAARTETGLTDQLFELMAQVTGRAREEVVADWERGRVLSADEAWRAGLIDEIDEPLGREAGPR